MAYDTKYAQGYYQKNKDKINARARIWQAANKEKHRKSWQQWRINNKERDNENWRKRYNKRKQQIEEEYGIMSRNIRNERVQLYLSNPQYYKEKLKEKIKEDQLAIAYYYLDDATHSLFATGRQFHISKERVRQICYKVLYKIWKMKPEEEDIMITNKNRKG